MLCCNPFFVFHCLLFQGCWNGCSDCECNHDTVHGSPLTSPLTIRSTSQQLNPFDFSCMAQETTRDGAKILLAAVAPRSSAMRSSKVCFINSSPTCCCNIGPSLSLIEGGGWDGTFYYKSVTKLYFYCLPYFYLSRPSRPPAAAPFCHSSNHHPTGVASVV
jgi:hypothetical protein